MNKKIEKLRERARANHVPIITDEGLAFLLELIQKNAIDNVLEIGAAVGYSTINMAMVTKKVDTFERDTKMLAELQENIFNFNLSNKITVYPFDALEYDGTLDTYDLIFIDAAKAQYQKFFEKYASFLNKDGIIVCDNLNFHNLKQESVSRQTRQLLKKIANFKHFLATNQAFTTTIYNIGDGMSVSKKNEINH